MKWKNRLTNYNFWISIVSAVLLILQNFNVQFDIANFNEIVTAVLGLLVVIGIINDPTKSATEQKTEKSEEKQNENNLNLEQVENKLINNVESNIIDKIVEISNKVDLIAEDEKKEDVFSEDLKTETSKQEDASFTEQDSNNINKDNVDISNNLDKAENKDIESEEVVDKSPATPINTQTEDVANINEAADKVFVTGEERANSNIVTEQGSEDLSSVNSESGSELTKTENDSECFVCL